MTKLLFIALLLLACDSTSPAGNTENKKNLIATKKIDAIEFSIYAEKKSLEIGYNKLFIQLKDKNSNIIKSSTLTTKPMMDMKTMKHSAPNEKPTFVDKDGYYETACSFIMAGMWTYTVTSVVEKDTTQTVFDLNIKPNSNVKKVTGSNKTTYFITLIKPEMMKVGMNDIEFLINQRKSMMSFPPVTSFTTEIDPTMPSMGHGSPNNVNPTHIKNGHYKGKINFTMSGEWKIELILKADNTKVVTTNFMITL